MARIKWTSPLFDVLCEAKFVCFIPSTMHLLVRSCHSCCDVCRLRVQTPTWISLVREPHRRATRCVQIDERNLFFARNLANRFQGNRRGS